MAIKTFQYRIYPTRSQERQFALYLDATRNLYNMCLAERKLMWAHHQQRVSKTEQLRQVKHYKRTFPQVKAVHSHALQIAVNDLDKAFQAFFRRIKAGETPGYPRFKSYKRWHSFGFKEYGNGFKVDGRRLQLSGIGRVRVRWHRPYAGQIKTCRIVRKADGWYVSLACEVPDPQPLPVTGQAVGIDVGLAHLLTTSDGEHTENPRWYREAQGKLRLKQRELARSKKGSQNRRKRVNEVQRLHLKVERQRKDAIDKIVDYLVKKYDLIAIEDLKPTNMVRNKHLSKSILDAGWGYFRERLNIKAVDAGCTVVAVNPACTSQTCSACGCVNRENRPDQATFCCVECGHSDHADVNAAKNILHLALNGRDTSVLLNVAH